MEKKSKQAVVVLGPGRSGTSVLMQALSGLGLRLSDKLLGPHPENPDGFFEDEEIVALHKRFLDAIGGRANMPPPEGWQNHEATASFKADIRSILEKNVVAREGLWGFKDPRTNALLPAWMDVFRSMWINPSYIMALREPAVIVRSMVRQASVTPELAELTWLYRTCDALTHTSASCFIVHYEDWFTRQTELAEALLKYTGLGKSFSGDMNVALKDIVKPNLNRSTHHEYQLKNPYVIKLSDQLRGCRGADFDSSALMSTVNECRAAMEGFKGWYLAALSASVDSSQFMRERRKRNGLEEELASVKQRLSDNNASSAQAIKELKERIAQLEPLADALRELETRVAEQSKDLEIAAREQVVYLTKIKDLHDALEEARIRASSVQKTIPDVQTTPALPRPVAQGKQDTKGGAQKRTRLWRKLRNNPHRYFADSRHPVLRPLRHLFKS